MFAVPVDFHITTSGRVRMRVDAVPGPGRGLGVEPPLVRGRGEGAAVLRLGVDRHRPPTPPSTARTDFVRDQPRSFNSTHRRCELRPIAIGAPGVLVDNPFAATSARATGPAVITMRHEPQDALEEA